MGLDRTSTGGIIHLVHPNPIPWSVLDRGLSSILELPTIPFDEWIARLEGLEQRSLQNATTAGDEVVAQVVSLLPFFRHAKSLWRERSESQGEPIYDISKAQTLSPLLRDGGIPRLSYMDVENWVTGWRKIGFLPT